MSKDVPTLTVVLTKQAMLIHKISDRDSFANLKGMRCQSESYRKVVSLQNGNELLNRRLNQRNRVA